MRFRKLAKSELLLAHFKQAGVEHELIVSAGAPHTFDLQPPRSDSRPDFRAFIDKHLKY